MLDRIHHCEECTMIELLPSLQLGRRSPSLMPSSAAGGRSRRATRLRRARCLHICSLLTLGFGPDIDNQTTSFFGQFGNGI